MRLALSMLIAEQHTLGLDSLRRPRGSRSKVKPTVLYPRFFNRQAEYALSMPPLIATKTVSTG